MDHREDHECHRGKVLAVSFAQLDDDTGAVFPADRPLLVVIKDSPLAWENVRRSANWTDTFWPADALPGRLDAAVAYIDGPSYYTDGVRTWGGVVRHPCAAFLSALPERELEEFIALLKYAPVLAGDWLQDHDGDAAWAGLFDEGVTA